MSARELKLSFSSDGAFELLSWSLFQDKKLQIRCTRGTSPSTPDSSTFAYTNGIKGLIALILHRKLSFMDSDITRGLVGERRSLAMSLDYAVSKQPRWIVDFFGCDATGRSLISKAVGRINPEKKRPGPVELYWNDNFVNPNKIKIALGTEELISKSSLMTMLYSIEQPHELSPGPPHKSHVNDTSLFPQFRVGLVSPASTEKTFYSLVLSGFTSGFGRFREVRYSIYPFIPIKDFDNREYLELVHNALNFEPPLDALVVVPDTLKTYLELTKACGKSNHPFIVLFDVTFDNEISGYARFPFVGGDELIGGCEAGSIARDKFLEDRVKSPRVLILRGSDTSWENRRVDSFIALLSKEFPAMEMDLTTPLFYDRSNAFQESKTQFTTNTKNGVSRYDLVFACNDDMALGARSAALMLNSEGLNFKRSFSIIGYDGTPDVKRLILERDPWLLGTVNVGIENQIESTINVIHRRLAHSISGLPVTQLFAPIAYRRPQSIIAENIT